VTKERQTRRADRANEWAVTVRLNDGRVLFWCGAEAGRLGQQWGRESQPIDSQPLKMRSGTPQCVRPTRRRGSTASFALHSPDDAWRNVSYYREVRF
jgi:hypothetical protein